MSEQREIHLCSTPVDLSPFTPIDSSPFTPIDSSPLTLIDSSPLTPVESNALTPVDSTPSLTPTSTSTQVSPRKRKLTSIVWNDFKKVKRYSNSLQPMFKMISRNTLKSDILKIYEREKSKTIKLLENVESRISLTSDIWTSNQTKKGFMAVTTHFIDDAWVLQSRILRFIYVPAPHNKEVLSDALVDCLSDWNIDRKLSTITLDNCTTNDAIIDNIGSKLDSSSLLLDGRVLHMRCCAHILNLIVKDGLEVIGQGIKRIRDSVVFWTAPQVVLDPRYKLRLVSYYFEKIYGEGAQFEVEKIRQDCYDLLHEYKTKSRSIDTSVGGETSYFHLGASNLSKDELFDYDLYVSSGSSDVNVKSELDIYLEEQVLPRTLDFDILNWWKENGTKYPTLQRIAQDILAISVLTVASESAFSTSGRLVSPHRSRLHPITLEALMCSQRSLKQEGFTSIYDEDNSDDDNV
ncbi:hypothetical protein F0562_010795 [Nyssa sinensis]|uniref:HAT C-terminal dimerisation domain-containing protein n=1 Tax=Nyssa sinensis TaxID=561372 RepID=A0A5J5A3J3_9ASTE|nr:hypothetical protein F0562_010795 [Nyssa sinensis]